MRSDGSLSIRWQAPAIYKGARKTFSRGATIAWHFAQYADAR
jgi:hypothetical protein